MPRHLLALAVVVLTTSACGAPSPGPRASGDSRRDAIDGVLSAYADVHAFSGAALVADGGRVVYEGVFGPASAELGVQNRPETRFRVASITKVFTAIVVLKLADEHLVDLDAPLGRYVRSVRRDIGDRVTPRQLLEHRSGLDREYLPADADLNRDYSLRELVDAVDTNTGWVAEPDAAVSYSNAGYVLLAALIENVTGGTYADAVRRLVLEPAGMRDTGFEESATAVVPTLATGYRVRLGVRIRADRVGMSWTRGNGGIWSTAHDLWLLDRALSDGRLLSSASTELMFTPGEGSFAIVWQVGAPPEGYPEGTPALAWARGANPGGFRTQWTRTLDGERVVILLANLDDSPRHEITADILAALDGNAPEPPRAPLSQRVSEVLGVEGVDAAVAAAREGARDDGDRLAGAVNELVELGHHLIRAQRASEAIDVLTVADRLFPDEPGIVVSLAYAFLRAGDRDRAAELAQRVLDAVPGEPDALLVLREAQPH